MSAGTRRVPERGSVIAGKYEVLGVIGQGGQGVVVEARHIELDRLVALKFLRPDLLDQESVVLRFEREARNAARLSSPYTARIYDVEKTADGVPFMVCERLEGRSLYEEIATRGPLPITEAVDYVLEVCAALAEAHALGIVHRDLKPSNIFLADRSGVRVAKLVDFGLSKVSSDAVPEVTLAGMVVGSPRCMSPEQIRGADDVDARADIWSLAVVLFHALTRAYPFEGQAVNDVFAAVLTRAPRSARAIRPDVPEALERVLFHALEKDRAHRPPTISDLAHALRPFASDSLASALFAHGLLAESISVREVPTVMATAMKAKRTNLVPSRTTFLGRTADIAAMGEVLAQTRLLTLVGPGGMGKTSLARRWAELRQEEYTAVHFCDLTDASDLHGVCSAVGRALDVALAGAPSDDDAALRIGEAMRREDGALVILDNCEQVADDVALAVSRWLSASTRTVFLATSREALRVAGERVYEVRPLSLPDTDAGEDVTRSEAVQLFLDRARSVRHDYVLAEADVPIVAGIVRDVDGLPLAIELAAARMSMMSPSSIAENMSRRFDLLAGRRRDTTARHQTLRATLDWSWNLLSPWEKVALAQCSLFRGGFTVEAAAAIVDVSSIDGAPSMLDVVQSLRDRSLIHAYAPRVGDELRLRLFESIREYAAERLGEDEPAIRRYIAYFARIGRSWASEANERGIASVDRRLALESENFMAARRFALSRDLGAAYDTMLALDSVLSHHGPFALHLPLLDETLAAGESSPKSHIVERARLILLRGVARRMRGMPTEAWSDFENALSLAREAGDLWTQARAESGFGGVCYDGGRRDEAATHFEAALAAFRAGGYKFGEATALGSLAVCHHGQGNLDRARELYTEQIARGRELDAIMIAWPLMNLGLVLQEQGRLDEARRAYDEAIELCPDAERVHGMRVKGFLGSLHLESGNVEDARRCYEEALAVAREIDHRMAESEYLGALGALYAASDRIDEAESALERAESLAQAMGAHPTSSAIRLHAGHVDLALARRCAVAGDRAGAERHIAEAKHRLEASDPSFEDVRFARRVLERALRDLERAE